MDPAHRPPVNHTLQLEQLRIRFAELDGTAELDGAAQGHVASRFLDGLLKKRAAKRQAQGVLALLASYHRADVLAAMYRAVRYHACSLSSLERILSIQAQPKPSWEQLSEGDQETLRRLTEAESIEARDSREYQYLLFEEHDSDAAQEKHSEEAASEGSASDSELQDESTEHDTEQADDPADTPRADSRPPGDAEDRDVRRASG